MSLQEKPLPSKAAAALRTYLDEHQQLSALKIARETGHTATLVRHWLKGICFPSPAARATVERLTDGAVPKADWDTPQKVDKSKRLTFTPHERRMLRTMIRYAASLPDLPHHAECALHSLVYKLDAHDELRE